MHNVPAGVPSAFLTGAQVIPSAGPDPVMGSPTVAPVRSVHAAIWAAASSVVVVDVAMAASSSGPAGSAPYPLVTVTPVGRRPSPSRGSSASPISGTVTGTRSPTVAGMVVPMLGAATAAVSSAPRNRGTVTAARPATTTAPTPSATARTGKDLPGESLATVATDPRAPRRRRRPEPFPSFACGGCPPGAPGNWPAAIMSAHHVSSATCSALSSGRSDEFQISLGVPFGAVPLVALSLVALPLGAVPSA